jgi:hypothetical protein
LDFKQVDSKRANLQILVSRLAITCGKNAKCYIANADNLGGYKMGSGGDDALVQTLTPPSGGAIFGNVGSYPLEGGFIYVSPVGSPTLVYSLGFDGSGRPAFTLVAQTDDSSPGAVGVGAATITTLNGQAGTAILWVVDTNGIRAYNAVPVNGKMIGIELPPTTSPSKFQRPAFGNGRYYMNNLNGQVTGYGSPVALPLNCSSPLDFGTLAIGSSSTKTLTCTANIAINRITGLTIPGEIYVAQNSSLPRGALTAGQSFSFPVIFNLTGYVLNSGSTSAPAVEPGVQTTAITLFTENGVTGYSAQQSVSLTGTSVSPGPWVSMSPLHVNFPSIVIGSTSPSSASTFIIKNDGQTSLKILGYGYATDDDGPFKNVTMGSSAGGNFVLDAHGYFTSQDLVPVGTTIAAGGSVTVHTTFQSSDVGSSFTILKVFSTGGTAFVILSGSANTVPIALLESSTNEGGWNTIPHCSDTTDGCTFQIDIGTANGPTTMTQTLRFTNNGGSALVITKSKPLTGAVLGAGNPSGDFSEGLAIAPGASAKATVIFQPGKTILNSDPVTYSGTWTLNTNDLTLGVHVLNFTGTLSPPRVGPLLPNGSAQFKYLGCFQDSANARLEATVNNNKNNTNGVCQTQAKSANLPIAGTEYTTECWVGFSIPPASLQVDDSKCTSYTCPGDSTQNCGGAGGYMAAYYDSTKYNPSTGNFVGGYSPPSAPTSIGQFKYAGCFTDAVGKRTLSVGSIGTASTATLDSCAANCKGYKYFGTENGDECYCGNSLFNSPTHVSEGQCKVTCAGNAKQLCGAGSRITLYSLNGSRDIQSTEDGLVISPKPETVVSIGEYNYTGCYADSVQNRTLHGKYVPSWDMSIESCRGNCTGYAYFGVEYGTECFCGNRLALGVPPLDEEMCDMNCLGNEKQVCGGKQALGVYLRGNGTIVGRGGNGRGSWLDRVRSNW